MRVLQDAQAAGDITVMDLNAWWRGRPCRGRPVILCFDEGGRSDVETVLPLLQASGLRASFFIHSASVGRVGYLDWNGIRALHCAGMGIESLGHERSPLPLLPQRELETQLRKSRHMLQDGAGTRVQYLAAPYGLWNRRVLETALTIGYAAVCTSQPGLAKAGALRLCRNTLRTQISARHLQAWLRCRPGSYAARIGLDRLLWTPKHILLYAPGGRRRVAPPPPAVQDSPSTF
ncbi:MAG TPA: polysaccharide deacetylase family protein [Terriglobales bacterium]|nr:polysaccharide deacetylase family protein [Terriglobales bacterium]